MNPTPTVLVAQLGARRHYAVPGILEEAGMLECLYTDLYLQRSLEAVLEWFGPMLPFGRLARLRGRASPRVPSTKVISFPWLAAIYAARRRLYPGRLLASDIVAGQDLCWSTLRHGWGNASAVYAFNTAGLELLRAARQDGLRTISDQTIVPKRMEERLLSVEREKWPEWGSPRKTDRRLSAYIEREETEWTVSDLIVCGSDFVKEAIRECGGPVENCVVTGSGVDLPVMTRPERAARRRSLRVLTVGEVGLRKGSPYVLKTAEALQGLCVFRMVGAVRAPSSILSRAPWNLEILGSVPHSELAEHYQWADVFFLPTVCEGAAISCYEALSCGVPVVCTFNAGISLSDAENGYVLAAGDLEGFIRRLAALAECGELLNELSQGASRAAQGFNFAQYGCRLVSVIRSLFA